MGKKQTLLIFEDAPEVLYVRADSSGIPQLIYITDGFRLTRTDTGTRKEIHWVEVTQVLNWFYKELRWGVTRKYDHDLMLNYVENIEILEGALQERCNVTEFSMPLGKSFKGASGTQTASATTDDHP